MMWLTKAQTRRGVAHGSMNKRARVTLKAAFRHCPRCGGLPASCPDGEDSRSCAPVDLQLSFPDTVAVMGGSEVTKLLKSACLPFINVTFKAPLAEVNHNYIPGASGTSQVLEQPELAMHTLCLSVCVTHTHTHTQSPSTQFKPSLPHGHSQIQVARHPLCSLQCTLPSCRLELS